jgi:hypothetical protein
LNIFCQTRKGKKNSEKNLSVTLSVLQIYVPIMFVKLKAQLCEVV